MSSEERRPRTEDELDQLGRVMDEVPEFSDRYPGTARWSSIEPDGEDFRVLVEVVTPDEAALRRAVEQEFGDMARVRVLAAAEWGPHQRYFSGWDLDPTGRELTVCFLTGPGECHYQLAMDEGHDAVTVRVGFEEERITPETGLDFARCELSGFLSEPLGERTVIDGLTMEVRPRGRRFE